MSQHKKKQEKPDKDTVTIPAAELAKFEEDRKKAAEYFDQMLRIQAEFENFRKRVTREKAELQKFANETLILELLPILDNFNRALKALEEHVTSENHKFFEGVEMIYRQMFSLLDKNGVKPIESKGKPFDPHVHHAIQQVQTDEYPEHTVIEEISTGYTLYDRVVKAASVIVSTLPESGKTEEQAEQKAQE